MLCLSLLRRVTLTTTRILSSQEVDVRLYERVADETLDRVSEHIDELADNSNTDVDITLQMGVLTVCFPPLGTFVLNKQRPNRQLWLSSPVSGPHRYDMEGGSWKNSRDKECLSTLLDREISSVFTHADFANCLRSVKFD